MRYTVLLLLFFSCNIAHALKIDRVILATDANPDYIQFWPLTASVWSELIGVRPTLVLVADDDVAVDESFGDVIRFKPIPGIPTSLQAQTIRLLIPACFENDVCIISDIDMLPLTKDYFFNPIENLPDDSFVVFQDKAYSPDGSRYAMCYNVAKGKTFKEIFDVRNPHVDIPNILRQWHALGHGWHTDEILLTEYLKKWNGFNTRCIKLGGGALFRTGKRIDRGNNMKFEEKLLRQGHYVDVHCCRPWQKGKQRIEAILTTMGLELSFLY